MSRCGCGLALGSVAVLAAAGAIAKRGSASMELANRHRVFGFVGDADPLTHGGGVVYPTEHGPYLAFWYGLNDYTQSPTITSDPEEDEWTFQVHQVEVPDDVVAEYDWIDWDGVAMSYDQEMHELVAWGRHPDPAARAQLLYQLVGYISSHDLDSYPVDMTGLEIKKRWPALMGTQKAPPSIRDLAGPDFLRAPLVPNKWALQSLDEILLLETGEEEG
jgi:hypothetical protein